MHERGWGRRRRIAILAIALALAVAAPELAVPAGAAVRSAARTEMHSTRPAAHAEFAAKRKKKKRKKLTAAQKKARLGRYLKAHPAVLAAHLKGATPTTTKAPAKKVAHPAKKKKVKKKKAKKGAKKPKKGAKKPKKSKKARAAAAAAAARRNKKKGAGHPLGLTDYAEMLFLALTPFAAAALVLLFSDFQRRPRAPSRTRRRRTLVITPMNRNR